MDNKASNNSSDTTAHLSQEQRALVALRRMKARVDAIEQKQQEPIAIIGMGCRFPGGVKDPASYWQLLREGRDGIIEVPASRWDVDAYYDPDVDAPGKITSRWGGFIDQVDQFDAAFFGIAPREAVYMDPQQRQLLEVAWEALESAGQTREHLAGSQTGVFIAIANNDYRSLLQDVELPQMNAYLATGNAMSIAANRISYIFDLQGPSLAVDTACSSSLVAIHLACQSLRTDGCHMALAGGVNLILSPQSTETFSKSRALASDGRCKTFDSLADGMVRSEGCGVVILKRLSQAQADGDPILATIRSSAVNQDGHSNGLTAPNVQAQKAVLRQALQQAKVEAEAISYIETHGTGTVLGDPIEFDALAAIYGRPRVDQSNCVLGAVKTNIGHLEAVAGVAGVMKVVLSLQAQEIPANLHFKRLNPSIVLKNTPFHIPTTVSPWPISALPRYAAVSSFGFGGTNAHVILEEAPRLPQKASEHEQTNAPEPLLLLPLAARHPDALAGLIAAYAQWLSRSPQVSLNDICYTASLRRSHFEYRCSFVGATMQEFLEYLQNWQVQPTHLSISRSVPPRLIFVFSGQGAQWIGMGQRLLTQEPVFRQTLLDCEQVLRSLVPWSLLDELAAPAAHTHLDQTSIAQPVMFCIQIALAALWRSWGIHPAAVVGHSIGEIAGAYVAGAFSLVDALRLVVTRGRLMQPFLGRGAMLSVALSPEQSQELIATRFPQVTLSVINSPQAVILAGSLQDIASVQLELEQQEVAVRLLPLGGAGHTPQMEPVAQQLEQELKGLILQPLKIPFLSSVTGEWCQGSDLNANYWADNVRCPVQFARTIGRLLTEQESAFLEVGPHPILNVSLQQCAEARKQPAYIYASIRRGQDEHYTLLRTLGQLYSFGYLPTWNSLYPAGGQVISLPTYSWQHERFWLNMNRKRDVLQASGTTFSSIEVKIEDNLIKATLHRTAAGQIISDMVFGRKVQALFVPASAISLYKELVHQLCEKIFAGKEPCIDELQIYEMQEGAYRDALTLQVIFQMDKGETSKVNCAIFSAKPPVQENQLLWHEVGTGAIRLVDKIQKDEVIQHSTERLRDDHQREAIQEFRVRLANASPEARQSLIEESILTELQHVMELQTTKSIRKEQKFAELGLDSLMAIELASRLSRSVGYAYSPLIFERYSSVDSLATYLLAASTESAVNKIDAFSPLVALNDAGDQPAFFCVPGIFGTVSILRDLSNCLGLRQPFYGLQMPGIVEGQEPFTNLVELATWYNQALRRFQPQGPYLLGGWSFGGVVAFEMACQLVQQGQEVALLAIIDAPLFIWPEVPVGKEDQEEVKSLVDMTKFMAFALGREMIALDYEDILHLPTEQREQKLLTHLLSTGETPQERRTLLRLLHICQAQLMAMRNYTPSTYPASITLFQALARAGKEHGIQFPENLAATWQLHCSEPIHTYTIPGDHFTMMKEPHVQQLAHYLQEHLYTFGTKGRN